MRRIGVLLLLAGLLLGAPPTSAATNAAADILALTALARYFPEDMQVYVGLRTDDAFIATLDAILARVGALDLLGWGDAPLSVVLNEMVSMALRDETATFETAVRPWLGDAAAGGISYTARAMTFAAARSGVVALSVTDRARAEAFIEAVSEGIYEKTPADDHTLFSIDDYPSAVAVMVFDEAMLIGPLEALPVEGWPEATLSDNPSFNAALNLLPMDDYDAIAYIDAPGIARQVYPVMRRVAGPRLESVDLTPFIDAIGPQAWGFTTLNGRALTMDVAQAAGDTAALEAMGLAAPPPGAPVDLGFAARIPADAPLVVQGAGFGTAIQAMLDTVRGFSDYMEAHAIPFIKVSPHAPRVNALLAQAKLADVVTFMELAFKGVMGLELEDALAAVDGDFAAFFRFDLALPAAADPARVKLVLDGASVFEATDPQAAQALVAALAGFLEQNAIDYAEETVGDAEVIVLPGFLGGPHAMYRMLLPQDLVIGANDAVFVAGTRAAATFSLAPPAGSLAEDPAFVAAQAYLLEDTEMLWYVGVGPLLTFVEKTAALDRPLVTRAAEHIGAVLRLFESAAMSAVTADNGDTVTRFVLTLAR